MSGDASYAAAYEKTFLGDKSHLVVAEDGNLTIRDLEQAYTSMAEFVDSQRSYMIQRTSRPVPTSISLYRNPEAARRATLHLATTAHSVYNKIQKG